MAKSFKDLPAAAQAGIFVAVAVAAASAVFYFYVWPLKAQKDALAVEVARLTAENQRNQAFEQQHAEYVNRIAQLQKQLDTLRSIVPDEQGTDEFMKMIFDTGNASNTHIRTFIPQALVQRELFVEMPFQLRLDGTYYSLLNFFDRLAHEQRIVSVAGLTLNPASGAGGMGAFKISPNETVAAGCTVITYYNRQQPAAPPPKKK